MPASTSTTGSTKTTEATTTTKGAGFGGSHGPIPECRRDGAGTEGSLGFATGEGEARGSTPGSLRTLTIDGFSGRCEKKLPSRNRDRVSHRLGGDAIPPPGRSQCMGTACQFRRVDAPLFPGPGVAFGDPQVLPFDRRAVPAELDMGGTRGEFDLLVALIGEHLVPALHDIEVDAAGQGRPAAAAQPVLRAADP